MSAKKRAVIVGAGPAGLTAAFELLTRTDIKPIILEKSPYVGGISKTVNYKGNRIDIGGHRFFSKSDRVMEWWKKILPIAESNHTQKEKVMLIRNRLSRIYYLKQFFSYPISLSVDTIRKLGFVKIVKIGFSYIYSSIFPLKDEKNLESFFINRFGKELYHTFFKDYTEKVWGISCKDISPEWGAQRIKGLTITKAIINAIASPFRKKSLSQKSTETSLIENFLYPKYGPGQLWEEVSRLVVEMGGEIHHHLSVEKISNEKSLITSVHARNKKTNNLETFTGDYFFSTMPIKEMIADMDDVPSSVKEVAAGLMYRDFITVGLLLTKLKIRDEKQANALIKDNWIYIQEKEVKIGRLQIFNNWSPYMVKDQNNVWIGLEYFCNVGDELWSKPDDEFISFAIQELSDIGIIDAADVIDKTILKEEKTYPAYFGSYGRFNEIKSFVNNFPNLFLIGRNGMHKYNNSDHSMLTAMVAVDNIAAGITSKDNIWSVNTEKSYHEKK